MHIEYQHKIIWDKLKIVVWGHTTLFRPNTSWEDVLLNIWFYVSGYVLPNRLIQLYENMSSEVKESIRSHTFGDLAPEAFAALPPQLFLLIPVSTFEIKSLN